MMHATAIKELAMPFLQKLMDAAEAGKPATEGSKILDQYSDQELRDLWVAMDALKDAMPMAMGALWARCQRQALKEGVVLKEGDWT